ncbi:MAG: histidine--tRNA ligase [Opitutae bacterium]|nr:histidine--tRNA ligase [Opitutae bacterium]|tara:strand:+ start:252 stop:1595 length:1344 start_codon:yes stop_codon:yes gene_type:complete
MFEHLPGFRDFYPEALTKRNHIFGIIREVAERFDFSEFDSPVLEPLDLYLEKSGEEIVSQLFHFTDQGGRAVALRPELTPSLARLAGAKAESLKKPIKWFHLGEHFRYERPQKGRLRSFFQFNADILGETDPAADAEVIALLISILREFGLEQDHFRVRLSDRVIWSLFLESRKIPETQKGEILAIIDKSGRRKPEATKEAMEAVLPEQSDDLLGGIEELKAVNNVESVVEMLKSFSLEIGDPADQRATDWQRLMASLESMGYMESVAIDLGIVRGLAYYTGFVYEVFETSGDSRALAGGGRYDHLVAKLSGGDTDLPATGFALGDVTLADCLEKNGLLPELSGGPDLYLVTAGEKERNVALHDASLLRQAGYSVGYALREQGFGKQFREAGKSGADFALIYGEEEVAASQVKIKDLASGMEETTESKALLEQLLAIEEAGGIAPNS